MGSKIEVSNVSQLKSLQEQIDDLSNAPAPEGVPVGTVLPFAGRNSAVPLGFLLCNGALVDRDDFIELFNVIGTDWGTTGSTTFNIPTTQGLLLRGVAYGSNNDPDRNSRVDVKVGGVFGDQVGSYQYNRLGSHNHGGGNHSHIGGIRQNTNIASTNHYQYGYTSGGSGNMTYNNSASFSSGYSSIRLGYTSSNSSATGYAGGNQSVGNNVGMNFIIKY